MESESTVFLNADKHTSVETLPSCGSIRAGWESGDSRGNVSSSVGVRVSMGLDEVSMFEIRMFTFHFVSEVPSCMLISSLPDRQTIHVAAYLSFLSAGASIIYSSWYLCSILCLKLYHLSQVISSWSS